MRGSTPWGTTGKADRDPGRFGPFGPAQIWVHRWAWVETALQQVTTVVLTGFMVWALATLYRVLPGLVVGLLAVLLGRGLLYLVLRVIDPR